MGPDSELLFLLPCYVCMYVCVCVCIPTFVPRRYVGMYLRRLRTYVLCFFFFFWWMLASAAAVGNDDDDDDDDDDSYELCVIVPIRPG